MPSLPLFMYNSWDNKFTPIHHGAILFCRNLHFASWHRSVAFTLGIQETVILLLLVTM